MPLITGIAFLVMFMPVNIFAQAILGYQPGYEVKISNTAASAIVNVSATNNTFSELTVPAGFKVLEIIRVTLDIREAINPSSNGKIAVTILSSPTFSSPDEVDVTSLTFGRTGNEPSFASAVKNSRDIDGDGLPDLTVMFYVQLTGIETDNATVTLKGMTSNNIRLEGVATIQTKGK